MPALHVCYILKRFPRLSQTFVLNELLALQRQDVPVTVVALRRSDEPLARADELRAPVCYLDELTTESSGDSGAQVAAIAPLVSTCGITHIHAHFATRAATVARQVSALTGVPFSFTAHAHDIFHSAIDGVALARTISAARFVITVSEYNRRYLTALLNQHGQRGRVLRLYNGVDLSTLQPIGSAAPDLIVGVGRLIAKKGFAELVDAMRLLRAEGRRVRCAIVGEGEERADLERRIAAASLDDVVQLLGARPPADAARIMASASVFALPCVVGPDGDRDGMPTVLVEAMALGTPVISTPVAGISELVEHERTGLLAAERDGASLAHAIARLLDDRELRERLCSAALTHVRAHFDLHTNVACLKRYFTDSAEDLWDYSPTC
jgi:glycosyltransferase involved in cell wall biosynthesis